jgi:hypothetical protein
MGKTAIANLSNSWVKRIPTVHGNYQSFFDKLRPAWRQKLMELVFFSSLDNAKIQLDWRFLSNKFIAPPPPPASPVPAPEVIADKRKSK